jgi:hypothetical protein
MSEKLRKLFDHIFFTIASLTLLLVTAAHAANNPVPAVTGPVKPQAVAPGSEEFMLTVYGANFVPGAVVNWNRSPRSTNFISARELQAQILASDVASSTAGYITVTNPAPGGGPSSSSYAIVEVHSPTKTVDPAPPHYYPLGGNAIEFLVAADFNADGEIDLLSGAGSGSVYLLSGTGDGTFKPASVVGHHYYNQYGCSHVAGDFNNDGKLDYIFPAGVEPNPARVEARLSNGDGTFRTSWRFGKYATCPEVAVGDLNGDGNLDFVVADASGVAHVFLGNGDGTFHRGAGYDIPGGAFNPVLADFNGDGRLDLIIDAGSGILLLLGNGDGTFQSPQTIFPKPEGCGFGVSLVVNDFNEDGKLDLAFCSGNGQIGVLVGNGNGSFKKPVYYHAGSNYSAWAFTAGDFNSDGKTDFINWHFENGVRDRVFAILLGNGDGTFQPETAVNLPDNIEDLGIVSGDFNSDGLLDFVMLNAGVQVYTQK